MISAVRSSSVRRVLAATLQQQRLQPRWISSRSNRSNLLVSTSSSPSFATTTTTSSSSTSNRFFSTSASEVEDAKSLAAGQAANQTPRNKKGFFGRLMDRMSLRGQQKQVLTAEMLFQAATRQANDPNWYGPGRIPRDFRSRHAMLTMHLWFLHKRLISSAVDNGATMDEDLCLRIQEELFTIFWEDTICRLRAEPNVREMSVNKYLMQVQQYTFLHMFHYDHIFAKLQSSQSHLDEEEHDEDDLEEEEPVPPPTTEGGSDGDEMMDPLKVLDPNVDLRLEENRISELKKLIWMHIMVRDPNMSVEAGNDDHLTRMAWYVECQYQNILVDWPGQYVEEARVKWVAPPSFKSLTNSQTGQTFPEQSLHPDDVIPDPWLKNITLRGQYYYWNPTNRQSQWEKPTSVQG